MATFMLGRGTDGSLTVPAKRLSFFGSMPFRPICSSMVSTKLRFLSADALRTSSTASRMVADGSLDAMAIKEGENEGGVGGTGRGVR
eukprot:contig_28565_g7025